MTATAWWTQTPRARSTWTRDGSLSCEDCDDNDDKNFPGNLEDCDGFDNDCDGLPNADADMEVDADGRHGPLL